MGYQGEAGSYGEEIARNFLIRKGYRVIRSNLKLSYKEIDIIAQKGDVLVFIEVKTRLGLSLGKAADALGSLKISRFKKAVGHYLSQFKGESFRKIRLDFIAIDIDKIKKIAKIKHFTDII